MHLTILSVINLKGGSGKTTTAAYVAHALHERGLAVLAVDADPQASLLEWHDAVSFPFPVVGLAVPNLHRQVRGIAADRYHAVVIDTPPTEQGKAPTLSAARAATHVLVPVGPTPIEYERLDDVRQLLEDATDLRPDAEPPLIGALLVRADGRTAAPGIYRDRMRTDGWHVLRTSAPYLQEYAQAFGRPIVGAGGTGYGDAVAELLDLDVVA